MGLMFGCGVDIGGTLCKVAYFERTVEDGEEDSGENKAYRKKIHDALADEETYGETGRRDDHLELCSGELNGRLVFVSFETRTMDKFLEHAKEFNLFGGMGELRCTGGGARKFEEKIVELAGERMSKADELECLVDGVHFAINTNQPQLFAVNPDTFSMDKQHVRTYLSTEQQRDIFPMLLVNIGSGVSILKVNADGTRDRVGGTSIGGATFYGLCSLITGCTTFEEALLLAETGDSSGVDLLVGDIYGGDLEEYNLPANVVAASLGKLVRPEDRENVNKGDIARGILDLITNNVGQISFMHAKTTKVQNVVFAGNFLRKNTISMSRLSYAIDFWSKGELQALFLKHEGYMGAIGAVVGAVKNSST
eukprot:m.148681 g.148681  ORF g.148681 m.148681 type:complete len:366 (-) comp13262_c2_seq8:41-1138(-)